MQKFNAEQNGQLLDAVKKSAHRKNDAALSRALVVAAPVISKIRHGRLDIGDSLLIEMHEITGMSIRDMKKIAGKKCLDSMVTGV